MKSHLSNRNVTAIHVQNGIVLDAIVAIMRHGANLAEAGEPEVAAQELKKLRDGLAAWANMLECAETLLLSRDPDEAERRLAN